MDLFFRKIIEQLRKETDQSIVTHCDKMSILLRKFNFQSYKKNVNFDFGSKNYRFSDQPNFEFSRQNCD